jgi:hypothetical protein
MDSITKSKKGKKKKQMKENNVDKFKKISKFLLLL